MVMRFSIPVTNARPNTKAHRFDVYGLKVKRSLALFKRSTVDAWVRLEADPAVTWYCERPLLIEDCPPKRIADFYVVRDGVEEIQFVCTQAEVGDQFEPAARWPGFAIWCQQNHIKITTFDPTEQADDDLSLQNWAYMLRELSAFGRYVLDDLRAAVMSKIGEPISLGEIEKLFKQEDPRLVRVACWSLVHSGQAACPSILQHAISNDSLLQAQ